jgi:flagellar motor switch protein FliN/FliY
MGDTRSQVEAVKVEISVLLGRSTLPMHQLLRMGRGAVIPLEASENDPVWILANEYPIARGEVNLQGERMSVIVTDEADVHDFYANG